MKTADVRPRVNIVRQPVFVFVLALTATLVMMSGCSRGPAESNVNLNVNTNINANANLAPANANTATAPSTLAAREPDRYSATLVFSAQTEGGEKTIGIPTLSAQVAKNGQDRRLQFKLPDGSDLIYLDHNGTPYAILPARKQYAELTPEATGFQLHKLMTPGQVVAYLDRLQGIQFVGEEQQAGRTALKYRYERTSQTKTSAGDVKTESFVYIDKDTGLPLRAEIFSEASGNVQGVKSAAFVAEMRDINPEPDLSLFDVPAGYNKIPEAQVRQQVDAIKNTVTAGLISLLTNMNTTSAPPPSPTPTVSPAATATP